MLGSVTGLITIPYSSPVGNSSALPWPVPLFFVLPSFWRMSRLEIWTVPIGNHVLELLLHLNRTLGTTLVLVTHDPVLAAYADRRIVLRDGTVIADELQQPAEMVAAR